MQPFSIQCTTCRRSLRVVNPEAIGQILSCPKCGSMVLIEAPEGWSLDSPSQVTEAAAPLTPSTDTAPVVVRPSPPPAASAGPVTPPVPPPKPKVKPTEVTTAANVAAAIAPQLTKAAKNVPPPAPPIAPPVSRIPVASATPSAQLADATAEPEAWPKWFLPGLGACLALGLLVFIVRLIFQPADNSVEPVSIAAHEPSAPATIAEEEVLPDEAQTPPPLAKTDTAEVPPKVAQADQPKASDTATAPAIEPPETVPEKKAVQESDVPRTAALPELPDVAVPNVSPMIPPPVAAVEPNEPAPNSDVAPAAPEPPSTPQSLQRVAPKIVDLPERLDHSLPAIEIRNMPLVDFVRLMGDLIGTPISLDVDELQSLGHSAATPVSLEVKDVTLGQALESALDALNLGYQERDGLLVIGSESGEMRKTRYRIPDLASDQAALMQFASLVEQFVAPLSWKAAGGHGVITQESDALLIDQIPPVQGQVLTFCEKLRVARSVPIKSKFPASRFELTPRRAKAADLLNRSVTANFASPVALGKVAGWLEDATGATILVDHTSLARQGTSTESECAVVAIDQSLAATLDQMLRPMELTWRAIDDKTVEITTPQAAMDRMEVEFYPASKLAPDATVGNALIQSIRAQIDPSLWGDHPGQCSIYFDPPSRALIVRAPQTVQNEVQSFLRSR